MDTTKYLTVKEAQKYLKIGANKMSLLLRADGFPCVRLGKRILIIREKLDEWMNSQVANAQ